MYNQVLTKVERLSFFLYFFPLKLLLSSSILEFNIVEIMRNIL